MKECFERVWRCSLHCAATTHSVPYPSVRCLIHTIIHRFILLWERGRKKGGVQHGRKWSSERRADGGTRQDEVRPSSGEASSPEIHWRENGRSLDFADSAHALKYCMLCNIKERETSGNRHWGCTCKSKTVWLYWIFGLSLQVHSPRSTHHLSLCFLPGRLPSTGHVTGLSCSLASSWIWPLTNTSRLLEEAKRVNLLLSWGFAIGWFQFLPRIPLIPLPGSENHSFLLPFQARVGTSPPCSLGMHYLLWFPSILLLCNKLIQTLTDTDVRSIKKGCTEYYSLEVEEATNCSVGGRWVGTEGFTGDVWAESYGMRYFLWIRLNLSLKTVLHLSGRCWCMQISMVCMVLKDSDYPAGLKSTENWSNKIANTHIPVTPIDNLACFLPDFLQSWNHTLYSIWILVFSNIT